MAGVVVNCSFALELLNCVKSDFFLKSYLKTVLRNQDLKSSGTDKNDSVMLPKQAAILHRELLALHLNISTNQMNPFVGFLYNKKSMLQ